MGVRFDSYFWFKPKEWREEGEKTEYKDLEGSIIIEDYFLDEFMYLTIATEMNLKGLKEI